MEKTFSIIKINLSHISIFHTAGGSEFKNRTIYNKLATFGIDRSLSKKACPYDNAVTEATFKIMKIEFASDKSFEELEYLLFDYVNWYNTKYIHRSLDYVTPDEFKNY